MNEDELRRLVLVNLARLTVSGEWNGLLTAASGGQTLVYYNLAYPQPVSGSFGYPINATTVSTSSGLYMSTSVVYATPFYAAADGDFNQVSLEVSSAGTTSSVACGIYSSTATGGIDAQLCTASIDLNGTGTRQGTFSGTTTAVAGTLYWHAHIFTSAASPTIAGVDKGQMSALFLASGVAMTTISDTTTGSLPATWSTDTASRRSQPLFGVTYS